MIHLLGRKKALREETQRRTEDEQALSPRPPSFWCVAAGFRKGPKVEEALNYKQVSRMAGVAEQSFKDR